MTQRMHRQKAKRRSKRKMTKATAEEDVFTSSLCVDHHEGKNGKIRISYLIFV